MTKGEIMAKLHFEGDNVHDLINRLNNTLEFISMYFVRLSDSRDKEIYDTELNGLISLCDSAKFISELIEEKIET